MAVWRSILIGLLLAFSCTLAATAADLIDPPSSLSPGVVFEAPAPAVLTSDIDDATSAADDATTVETNTLDTKTFDTFIIEQDPIEPELEPPYGLEYEPEIAFECCDPLWTFRAGSVFFRRDHQSQRALVDGATPFSAGTLAFDYEPGPMFDVIRHRIMDTPWDLQVTYFGIHSFFATASSAAATSYATVPPINFGARTVTSNYLSDLDSTEINFRHIGNEWMTLLLGFRWIELHDELGTDLVGSFHNIDVNNHLYGAQVGVDTRLWSRGAFSMEGLAKVGIYGNAADQNTAVVNVGGAVPQFAAGSQRAAFAGELALTGSYLINDRWSLRGGYQALWLDGVALAPDQLDNSDIGTGAASLNLKGAPIYHGFVAAAEFVW